MSIEDRWVSTTTCKWPKKEGYYILSLKDGYVIPADHTIIDDKHRWYEIMPVVCAYGQDECYIPEDNVSAWMSLPQAYKKGD